MIIVCNYLNNKQLLMLHGGSGGQEMAVIKIDPPGPFAQITGLIS